LLNTKPELYERRIESALLQAAPLTLLIIIRTGIDTSQNGRAIRV